MGRPGAGLAGGHGGMRKPCAVAARSAAHGERGAYGAARWRTGLAGWVLHLYEDAWSNVARLSPTACLVELVSEGDVPLEQAQRVVFHILTRVNAPLLRNPDDLALVLTVLLLAAMAGGVALWRAIARARAG